MQDQLSLFNSSSFELKIVTDRRELNNKNHPASGWLQEYYKDRCGKTTTWEGCYGPYYQFCYKIDNKQVVIYVPRNKQGMVMRMIGEGRRAEEIAKYLKGKRLKKEGNS